MKKNILLACIAVAALLTLSGCKHQTQSGNSGITYTHHKSKPISNDKTNNSTSTNRTNQKSTDDSDDQSLAKISNDEWILMGYMAYARKNYEQSENVHSTAEMVNAVENDLDNDDLTCTKDADNKYSFSNKFGSVDGSVSSDNITITGDGTTTVDKSKLKDEYVDHMSQIQAMTKKIGSQSDNNHHVDKFSLQEYVVAGFLEANRHGNTPKEKIEHVENQIAKGIHVTNDGYLSGLYKNNGKYGAAYNPSTSQYTDFTFNGNNITGTNISAGVISGKLHLTKQELERKYGPYRADLTKILQGLEYNKKHAIDFYKK